MIRKLITQQGLLVSMCGLLIVFASLYWSSGNTTSFGDVFLQFIQSIGITLFAFGLFSIIIDSKNWKSYFENRLKEIVVDHNYLNSLDDNKLKILQIDVMKAIFKNPHIDKEKSFLNYFHQNLHGYISEPYREDVSTEVILKGEKEECHHIFDRVSYACRKTVEGIQKYVTWRPDQNEFLKVLYVKMEITYPRAHKNQNKTEILHEGKYVDKDPSSISIKESLEKYNDVDGLMVTVTSEYLVKKHRFQYWEMAHPTKNLDMTIKYPEDMEIQYKQLVLNPEICQITEQQGYLKVKFDSWMLPQSGLAWRFYTQGKV